MKILIVSDTHGRHGGFDEALMKETPFDLLLHAGDLEGGEDYMDAVTECEAYFVKGNNDFFSFLPGEREILAGGHRIFMAHGHNYGVSLGEERILDEGRSRGADIVVYGHTHRPTARKVGGMWIVNPGSLSYPRQEGRRPSYAVLYLDADGRADCEIRYL